MPRIRRSEEFWAVTGGSWGSFWLWAPLLSALTDWTLRNGRGF